MYLFKVECEFTVKEYNPEVMSEPKYFRAYSTSVAPDALRPL